MAGLWALPGMEHGIEAGDLWQLGEVSLACLDKHQIVGLVERRQCDVRAQLSEYLGINRHRLDKLTAAVNHPVTDSADIGLKPLFRQPVHDLLEAVLITQFLWQLGEIELKLLQ